MSKTFQLSAVILLLKRIMVNLKRYYYRNEDINTTAFRLWHWLLWTFLFTFDSININIYWRNSILFGLFNVVVHLANWSNISNRRMYNAPPTLVIYLHIFKVNLSGACSHKYHKQYIIHINILGNCSR